MYINRAPVYWSSKRQPATKASTFAAEFRALRAATELIEAQRYKLRMMGTPIDGPAEVRCDNQSVVYNASRPESVLKKKSESISYHYVRERCAMGVLLVYFIKSQDNLADILTKVQSGPVRLGLVKKILH